MSWFKYAKDSRWRGCGGCVLVIQMLVYVGESEVVGCEGDVAQMVERSLSMREVLGSIPSFSIQHWLL